MFVRSLLVILLLASAFPARGQDEANRPNANWPGYREGDYVTSDYKFASGQSLPEVRLHYRTIGTAKRNAAGAVCELARRSPAGIKAIVCIDKPPVTVQ